MTPGPLAPLFICFFPPPRPTLCKLGSPGVLFVLPEVLTLVLGPSFDLPFFYFHGLFPSLSFSHRHFGPLFSILTTKQRQIGSGQTARVSIDILGISELKWTGMGEFNSDDHYIYYCGQESLRIKALYSQPKTRPGADCGSDHELLIARFKLKLKKVGKTTRPFRYDLNQIPYNYTVEVTNRFRGLDLIDRVPEELWIEVHDIV